MQTIDSHDSLGEDNDERRLRRRVKGLLDKPQSHYLREGDNFIDKDDPENIFSLGEVQHKFDRLEIITQSSTQIPAEFVKKEDILNLISLFEGGNLDIQKLFKNQLSKNRITDCWIDNGDPRVLALNDNHQTYYFQLSTGTPLKDDYVMDLDPKHLNKDKLIIKPSGDEYFIPGLGTEDLDSLTSTIENKIKKERLYSMISPTRVHWTLMQALKALVKKPKKPIYIRRSVFKDLTVGAKLEDTGKKTDEARMVDLLNFCLEDTKYQIEKKSSTD